MADAGACDNAKPRVAAAAPPVGVRPAGVRGTYSATTMRLQVSWHTVAWAHCDVAGIVFYPHFHIWFDQNTERLFGANRLSYAELKRDFGIGGMPLLETGATYRSPCRLGDAIEIRSWVDEWARKTFVVRHEIARRDGPVAVTGFERRALVVPAPQSEKGMKALAIPDEIRNRFLD